MWEIRLLALFSACLASCSLTLPRNTYLNASEGKPKPVDQQLCRGHQSAISITIDHTRSTKTYRVEKFIFRFRDTGNKNNDKVAGEFWYQNSSVLRWLLAILIPGTGDRVSTDGSPELLVAAGFDVLRFFAGIDIFDKNALLKKETITETDLRAFARAGKDVIRLRACDYLAIIDHFDGLRNYEAMGISGISLGGIDVPIISGMHEKIGASLPIISGGNITQILRTSQENRIAEIRSIIEERFVGNAERTGQILIWKHWGIDPVWMAANPPLARLRPIVRHMIKEEFVPKEKILWQILGEELWEIDPLRFAPSLNSSKTRIIANYWDTVIRYEFARQLWQISGKPDLEIVLFPLGHYGSALLLWVPMVRWELKCLVGPVCVPIPWSIGRVPEINLQFFKKTLPRS